MAPTLLLRLRWSTGEGRVGGAHAVCGVGRVLVVLMVQ